MTPTENITTTPDLGPAHEAPAWRDILKKLETPAALYTYRGTIVRVVDGDTLRVALDLGFGVEWRGQDGKGLSLRLLGVDCAELRGGTPETREAARAAKTWVEHTLPPGTPVLVRTVKDRSDNFGRYLATIHYGDGENLNAKLLEFGFAEVVP